MTILSVASLAAEVTTPKPSKLVGPYIGRLGKFGPHCWEAKESVRTLFYTQIRPEVLQHLNGLLGSVASRDIISVTLYMIGRRPITATPTVLFVSENESNRKEARKMIKDSGILEHHRGWKTAHAFMDPGRGAKLEQLATGLQESTSHHATDPITQVLYDRSQPLRSQGMTLYVSHDSGLRTLTANLIRLHGKTYYLAPAHAFFERPTESGLESDDIRDDFEIDSDDEFETVLVDSEMNDCGTVELDEQESDTWSASDEDIHTFSEEDVGNIASSRSSFGSIELTDAADAASEPIVINGLSLHATRTKSKHPPLEQIFPDVDALAVFGALTRWSIDKDWALVEVSADSDVFTSALLGAGEDDLGTVQIANSNPQGAALTTYTTSSGEMTGTMLSTPSDIRVPYGTSFQQVFPIKLDGNLADGDCGSAVFDAITGELYGHIVAGCRATGFAYVMPMVHVMPDLREMAPRPSSDLLHSFTGVGKVMGRSTAATSAAADNSKDSSSYGLVVPRERRSGFLMKLRKMSLQSFPSLEEADTEPLENSVFLSPTTDGAAGFGPLIQSRLGQNTSARASRGIARAAEPRKNEQAREDGSTDWGTNWSHGLQDGTSHRLVRRVSDAINSVYNRVYATLQPRSEIQNVRIWEVLRATSAAPTFFNQLQFNNDGSCSFKNVVDGGTCTNNPTTAGQFSDACFGEAQPGPSNVISRGTRRRYAHPEGTVSGSAKDGDPYEQFPADLTHMGAHLRLAGWDPRHRHMFEREWGASGDELTAANLALWQETQERQHSEWLCSMDRELEDVLPPLVSREESQLDASQGFVMDIPGQSGHYVPSTCLRCGFEKMSRLGSHRSRPDGCTQDCWCCSNCTHVQQPGDELEGPSDGTFRPNSHRPKPGSTLEVWYCSDCTPARAPGDNPEENTDDRGRDAGHCSNCARRREPGNEPEQNRTIS